MRLALLLVCATASLAAAEPRFEIIDRNDAVEIIARDVKATSTAITPVRSRLEVPIEGRLAIPKLLPAGDKTIKVVELDGHSRQVLSVKLGFERLDVQTLAKHAQAIQVGDDLHVIVPRAVPAAGQPVALPEPTLPPQLAEKAAAIAPVPQIQMPAKTEAAKPEAAPPVVPAKPQPVAAAPAPEQKKAPVAGGEEPTRFNTAILGVLALVALGCGVWMKKRNRNAAQPASSIDIIAQKAIGAKAKIVWLRAGEREMIVAVAPQSVRMLGQWKKGEAPATARAPLPEAVTHSPSERASSPAVAGILKLRARTNTNTEEMLYDGGDADAAWAKEILAATTGARR